jgi:hypothetical protein
MAGSEARKGRVRLVDLGCPGFQERVIEVRMPKPTHSLNAEPGRIDLTGRPVRMIRDLGLDRNGPFFEYVVTYLCASAGFTPVYDAVGQPAFMAGTLGVFPGFHGNVVHMDLDEAVQLARDGTTLPQVRAEQRLCCMLANAAYEALAEADRKRLRGKPAFEFFRHVRNAASHNNKWHFTIKRRVHEPSRHAEWGAFTIDHTLKGPLDPLHDKDCIYGTLHPADLLGLLRDVEVLLK